MKKNRKRIVAAFMTVLMALTLVPTWLLGGAFATTAKADGETKIEYEYSRSDVDEENKLLVKEFKDGDGLVAKYEIVGGGKEDVISDGKWDFRPTSGYDVATEIPKKGFIRVTAGKTCDVTLSIVCGSKNKDLYIVKNGDVANKQTVKVGKEATDVSLGTLNKDDVVNVYVASGQKIRCELVTLKGNFKIIAAPDAKASAIKATQDTTDPSKVSVDVSGLSVNEKGPDAYYAVERVKTSYGSDAEPDWNDAEEVYKYTGKETSFKYDDTVSKSGTYYYRVVGKGVASDDSVGAATTAGIQYEAALEISATGDVNKVTATWADIETASSYNVYVYKNTFKKTEAMLLQRRGNSSI